MNRLRTHPLPAARLRDALASDLDSLPDAELLDRFARYADHPAFESLLRRHGAMVFGVCRRMLARSADAEDAFQATFLVLIRKARSLRRGDRLGPWLYGVAYRVALKARSRAARLAARTTEATAMIPDPTPEPPDWLPVLDAELSALPAKYRDALVLCELEGASRAEAAKSLGVPEGTLSSRLARGRDLLRRRLLKHGTLLPAGGLAALFATCGLGRATVPAALLMTTFELAAIVGTGTAAAGAVPAGAARLTDEVLRGMFITKLRAAGAALLALTLVTVGVAAAWPGEAPGQPKAGNGSTKGNAPTAATDPKQPDRGVVQGVNDLHAVGFVDKGTVRPDRDLVQGLWVVEKVDFGKKAKAEQAAEAKELVGKMQFLVAGDVWWMMAGNGDRAPMIAKVDSAKNPKWLDLTNVNAERHLSRCIYELAPDRLRIAMAADGSGPRPAEFGSEDGPIMVLDLRREKMPPAAGEKALVGSWEREEISGVVDDGKPFHLPAQRVEVLDGYLFVYSTAKGRRPDWIGGKYTVDTTKNPKWIDVSLTEPLPDGKVTRLYGCYEVADGRLQMALGTKRATRPLEFKEETDVLLLNVKATKGPLALPVALDSGVPAPRPKDKPLPKAADGFYDLVADQAVRKLMKAGDFAAAERMLRGRLPGRTSLARAEDHLLLGICVLERARAAKPDEAPKLVEEAWTFFGSAAAEAGRAVRPDERAAWIQTQAWLRGLQVLLHKQKPEHLFVPAAELLEKHRGTVEELILLSLVYHAHRQKGDPGKALDTQDKMKKVFDGLKDKAGAFPAESGEYSKGYWEKVWFADGTANRP
jgi:RNA polymerase sigma factor (sigma-70 family)